MIEQYTSPVAVNNSQEPWLVGEGVVVSGGVAIPSLDFNFITGGLPGTVTFTRASTATYFNSAGVLTSAAINEARFDYNPATLAARGLLIEEQRTNLQVNSEDFTNVDWSKGSNTTITANQSIAPDGALTADRFGDTSIVSGVCQVADNQTKAASAITYTGSIYVKATAGLFFHFFVDANGTANSGRVIVDTTNWTVFSSTNAGTFTGTSGTVTSVGNGWYRITCTTTSGTETNIRFNLYWSNSNSTVTFTPSGTEQVYIWGAQLEAGAFPTSYIPTTTTALTRSADVASVNTLSPWYNASEGTLFAEVGIVQAPVSGIVQVASSLNDATLNNRITTAFGPTLAASMLRNTSGAGLISTSASNLASIGVAKVAVGFSTGASLSLNGGAVATNASYAVPTVTQLQLGAQLAASYANGYLRRITYYPRRLSNAELQAITA